MRRAARHHLRFLARRARRRRVLRRCAGPLPPTLRVSPRSARSLSSTRSLSSPCTGLRRTSLRRSLAALDAKVIDHHGAASARSQRKVAARTRARADREVATLTILRNANVIAMLGVEYVAGTTRIVLEDGGMDLYRFVVNHGKIDKCEAIGLFRQLVAAVCYPHSRRLWSARRHRSLCDLRHQDD